MSKRPVIILGGGLWGGLLAYRWQQLHPNIDFLLVEAQESLGGNHTWCFHEMDIPSEAKAWLSPFIVHSWDSYLVKFPSYEKLISKTYHALNSKKFHQVISAALPQARLRLSTKMDLNGANLQGDWVIDARGIYGSSKMAYQKFLGLELELEQSHDLKHPVLMDAKVSQLDGFRFIYSLPFASNRILIEDTRYSSSPKLDEQELKKEILKYAADNSWKVRGIVREERGVLPLPLAVVDHEDSETVNLAGIFHDTTGYSLPDAVRLIDCLLKEMPSKDSFKRVVENYRKERNPDRRFFRLLNRFMFKASPDEERYRMLQFFYRRSPHLISQFYSGKLSAYEKICFFIGRPPVSILRALKEILA